MNDAPLERLSLLVLLRVAAAPKGEESAGETRRRLAPFLADRHSAGEAARRVDAALASLVEEGLLERRGRASHAPTAAGRAGLERRLGVDAMPLRRAFTTLVATHLAARALGLPVPRGRDRERLRSADGLRAALLARTHALPLPPFPTLTQVGKALAWKRLAGLLARPLPDERAAHAGSGPVVAVLAGDWLGDGRDRPLAASLKQLAARAAGASSPEADALRRGLVQAWLRDEASAPAPKEPEDLEGFAREVLAIASGLDGARFGRDLVFLAPVEEAWRARHPDADRKTFERFLTRAANRGLLALQRADLVEAMDADLVRRSEVEHLGTRFHFVRVDG